LSPALASVPLSSVNVCLNRLSASSFETYSRAITVPFAASARSIASRSAAAASSFRYTEISAALLHAATSRSRFDATSRNPPRTNSARAIVIVESTPDGRPRQMLATASSNA
jgi:hypothetical protein